MERKKRAWAAIAVLAAPIGSVIGRMHVVGPNPGTFFALGILATLSIGGIAYGFREGFRVARDGRQIGK